MPPRQQDASGRYILNFDADYLDRIETPLPDINNKFRTTSKGRISEDMASKNNPLDRGVKQDNNFVILTFIRANLKKLSKLKIEEASRTNIKSWEAELKMFLGTQGY